MIYPENTTPANTVQGVIRQIVEDALNSAIPEPWEVAEHATQRILAAIGAGGQAVDAELLAEGNAWYSATQIEEMAKGAKVDIDALLRQLKHCADKPMRNLETFPTICADAHKLLSALAHPVQPGWRLVPEEPTLAMQNAGWREAERQGIDINEVELSPIYRAMLSAAPLPGGAEWG